MKSIAEDDLIVYHFKKPIKIVPLSDLHIGAKACKYNEIKRVVNYIKENENVYYTLGGDLIDNAVVAGKLASAAYDCNMNPKESIDYFCELFDDISQKCLCIIPGNHEDRTQRLTSINPAEQIATRLNILDRYRDCYAGLKIKIGTDDATERTWENHGKSQTYGLLVHHGKGTSETAVKKAAEFVGGFEGVDVCIVGHVHSGRIAKKPKRRFNLFANKIVPKTVTYIVTNSFLGEADYAKKNMLPAPCNDLIEFELLTGDSKKVIVTHY